MFYTRSLYAILTIYKFFTTHVLQHKNLVFEKNLRFLKMDGSHMTFYYLHSEAIGLNTLKQRRCSQAESRSHRHRCTFVNLVVERY